MENAEIRLECLKLAVSLVTGSDAVASPKAHEDPIKLADEMAAFVLRSPSAGPKGSASADR